MKKMNSSILKRTQIVLFISLALIFLQLGTSYAQSSQGTEFRFCFPANYDLGGERQLYITSQQNSIVSINVANPAFATVVNVAAGTLATVTLPVTVDVTTNGVIENKAIHITSDNPVTVYGMSRRDASTDAFLALPVNALGTDYLVLAYVNNVVTVQMTIAAHEDNTSIAITPTVTNGGFTAGVQGNIVLNAGQTFQLQSGSMGADYTGTVVISDKPIAVFGGNSCVNIPTGAFACDHVVEQMTPTTTWGQSFVTVPLATRTAGDIFRILARDNGTQVSINGGVVANLNRGQFYETSLSSASYNRINSDKPVLVGQYCKGSSADGVNSDPFFALVPPSEQFLNSYTISAGTVTHPVNYLNITSPTSNTGTVLVDGSAVPGASWTPIPGTTFSGAQVSVGPGVHSVTSVLPVGLLIYGFGFYDSYGYLGGQAFAEVATINSLVLTPATGGAQINTNQCWNAEVLNNFNEPVEGVRVDFTITGVNPGAGFAFTNASGIATYCFTGTNPGDDVITATVGSFTDDAEFTWTDQPTPAIPVSNWALMIGIFMIIVLVVWRFRKA